MIEIDGTFGEGGGQILRTSLTLSALTGEAFHIARIRGRRSKPGLRRQHLTSVRAAAEISAAEVHGAQIDSTDLTFKPATIRSGKFHFDIGTAGGAMLVVQTALPILLRAGGPSTLTVIGGTHNPLAPPFEFLNETFLPAIRRMGFRASARLDRHGFYPAGGGEVVLAVQPATEPHPVDSAAPEGPAALSARVISSKLPRRVWENEKSALESSGLEFRAIALLEVADSPGPGNCVMIAVDRAEGDARARSILTGFGERGKHSNAVVKEAADCARELLASGAAVDRYLADQLLIYMALAGGGSMTAPLVTLHATTNMAIIEKFLPVRFEHEALGTVQRIRCTALN